MGAVFIRRSAPNGAVVNEVIGVIESGRGKCVMSQNAQTREARFKLRLQSVVTVVGAVAEEVDSLCPTETIEKRFTFVSIRLIEVTDGLVDVKGRAVAGKDVRAFVADVSDFDRGILFELMLNRNVPGINGRQGLVERPRS